MSSDQTSRRTAPLQRGRSLLLHITLSVAASIGLGLLATQANGQEPPLTVELAGFTSSEWPEAEVVTTVLGADGRPVEGLEADAFQVTVDGAPVEVTSVDRAVDGSVGVAVVLAIDVSGSMTGTPLEQAKAAAQTFLNGLGPNDEVAVITFADTVGEVLPFTTDRAAATAAINGLTTRDGTALYDATITSVRKAAASDNARATVILLSDGVDNTNVGTANAAMSETERSRVPVFTISLGGSADADPAYLRQLAEISGGGFSHTPNAAGLADIYASLAELLRGQYLLALDGSGAGDPGSSPTTVGVSVTAGAQSGSAERVFAPAGPSIRLTGLSDSGSVSGVTTVTAEVEAAEPIAAVVFLLDGQPLKTVTEPPYTLSIDADDLGDSEHTLTAGVITTTGNEASVETTIQAGAAPASSNGMFMWIGVAVVGVVAFLAVAWLVLRKRGGDAPEPAPPLLKPKGPMPSGSQEPAAPMGRLRRLLEDRPQATAEVDIGQPLGQLVVLGGGLSGQSFAVGDAAASIGAGHRCLIQIEGYREDGEEIGPEEARIWVRGGQLMVHLVRRLTAMGAVGGGWIILGTGESFTIGDYTFRFELDPAVAAVLPKESPFPGPDGPSGEPATSDPQSNGERPAVANVSDAIAAPGEPAVPNIWRDKPNVEQGQGPGSAPPLPDQPAMPQVMPTMPPQLPADDAPRLLPPSHDTAEEASG
jgi:VWFA-related protein